jgi:hypothetical protein
MSSKERVKGRNGQWTFSNILNDRDWIVSNRGPGVSGEDLVATDPDGNVWACEVKTTKAITTAQRDQAKAQAKEKRLRWMLASKIENSSFWLVQRQGFSPVLWSSKAIRNPVTCEVAK